MTLNDVKWIMIVGLVLIAISVIFLINMDDGCKAVIPTFDKNEIPCIKD